MVTTNISPFFPWCTMIADWNVNLTESHLEGKGDSIPESREEVRLSLDVVSALIEIVSDVRVRVLIISLEALNQTLTINVAKSGGGRGRSEVNLPGYEYHYRYLYTIYIYVTYLAELGAISRRWRVTESIAIPCATQAIRGTRRPLAPRSPASSVRICGIWGDKLVMS